MSNDENLKFNDFTSNLQKAKLDILNKSKSFTSKEFELLQKIDKLKGPEGSIFDLSTLDILDKVPKILSKEKKIHQINNFIVSNLNTKNQNEIKKEEVIDTNEDHIIEQEQIKNACYFVRDEQNNPSININQEYVDRVSAEDENENFEISKNDNIKRTKIIIDQECACMQNKKDYHLLQVNDDPKIKNSPIPKNKNHLLKERNLLFQEIAKLQWEKINMKEKILKDKLSSKKMIEEHDSLKNNKEKFENEKKHLTTILEELYKKYLNSQSRLDNINIDIANAKILAEQEKIKNQTQIEQLENLKLDKNLKLKNLIFKNSELVKNLALYIAQNSNSRLHDDLTNVKSQIDVYQKRISKITDETKTLKNNLEERNKKNQLEKDKLTKYLNDLDHQLEKFQKEEKKADSNFEPQKEQFRKNIKLINEKISDLQLIEKETLKGSDEKFKEICTLKDDIEQIKIENKNNEEHLLAILTDLSTKSQKKYDLLNENKKRTFGIKEETCSIIEALKSEILKYENIIKATKERISEIHSVIKLETDKKNVLQLKIDLDNKKKQESEQKIKNLKKDLENVKIMIDGAKEITKVLENKKYNANLEISRNRMFLEKVQNIENSIHSLKNEISQEKQEKTKIELEKKKIIQEKNTLLKNINEEKKKQKGGFSFFDLF